MNEAAEAEVEEQEEEECPKCPPVGAPAWMATFADMATLLMAFFVLMGCCQFAHDVDNVDGRLEYMGAIVLTCCAYKVFPP